MNTAKRPLVIWVSLVYLAVTVLFNLTLLYGSAVGDMRSGAAGILAFVVDIGMEVLLIVTIDAIGRRSGVGQRLGILSFSLLTVFSVFSAVTLYRWQWMNGPAEGLAAATLVLMTRICISFILAIVFGVSRSVDRYFAEGP